MSLIQLEFGCGATPKRPGYKTCDIRDIPGIDFVCSAVDIADHCAHNSVSHIFSRHMFEHLSFFDGKRHLDACMQILAHGGEIELCLPNMDFHVQQWISQNPAQMDHARAGFWGWQREGEQGEVWDIHKSGYNFITLQALLIAHGFTNIRSLKKSTHKHLWLTASKP